MTSSVFFKFKSQKEPSRVEFDGTGISVFELKRDIIIKSGLGDGTDFDLAIYAEDGTEEYDDDTTIIPRSTTVIARRLPPLKPGAGRAARYVSGRMPASAKNSSRRETNTKPSKPSTAGLTQMSNALTEEEKLAAMFQVQSDQWTAQQEEMSHQAPVFKPGAKKPANVPDHDPPNGYICYRCGQKGHWIQVCPTNDNPEFDNRPRVKRTTGIPRSFLKTVDKSALQQNEGEDGVKPPAGVMVNADGEFVIAEPDKASWERFKDKTKSSAAAQKAASEEDKELEEKGLLCAIDKKLFIDPMKTPCCEKTYCNDCITNALIESDFVCPGCQTGGVLIDDLKPDAETSAKISSYLKEKEAAKTKERSKSPTAAPSSRPATDEKERTSKDEQVGDETKATKAGRSPSPEKPVQASSKSKSPTPNSAADQSPKVRSATKSPEKSSERSPVKSSASTPATSTDGPKKSEPPTAATSKKRPADEVLENPKIPKGPKAMMKAQENNQMQGAVMNNMGMMPNMMMNPMMMNGFNPAAFNNMNMNMPMGMPMMPNMNMMNPMMGMNGYNGGYQNMGGYNNNFGGNMGGMGMGNMNANGNGGYQPSRTNFTQPNNDDDAYFRKPVNPNRHLNRQRRNRPSDYREL